MTPPPHSTASGHYKRDSPSGAHTDGQKCSYQHCMGSKNTPHTYIPNPIGMEYFIRSIPTTEDHIAGKMNYSQTPMCLTQEQKCKQPEQYTLGSSIHLKIKTTCYFAYAHIPMYSTIKKSNNMINGNPTGVVTLVGEKARSL